MIKQAASYDFANGAIGEFEQYAYLSTEDTAEVSALEYTPPSNTRGFMLVTMIMIDPADFTKALYGKKLVQWKNEGGSISLTSTDVIADFIDSSIADWAIDTDGANIRVRVTPDSSALTEFHVRYENHYFNITPP